MLTVQFNVMQFNRKSVENHLPRYIFLPCTVLCP